MRTLFFFTLFSCLAFAQTLDYRDPGVQRDFRQACYEALGISPSPAVDQLLLEWRRDAWQQQNQGEIEGTLFIVQHYRTNQSLPAPQRAAQQALLRTAMVQNFRNNALTDPVAARLVRLYDQAHPALAPGQPPLTEESAEAWLELLGIAKTGAPGWHGADRQQAKRELIAAYPQMPPDRQQFVFQMIFPATQYTAAWSTWDAPTRQARQAQLRSIFFPSPQPGAQPGTADAAAIQSMLNRHNFQMMQNQLNFMKQNTDTIMGNGQYFDYSCNCWKQRGGIVTEYHE